MSTLHLSPFQTVRLRPMAGAAVMLALLLAAAAPMLGQEAAPSPEEAARLEAEAEAARADAAQLEAAALDAAAEIARLQQALVAAARDEGDSEREAIAVETRLASLAAEEAELAAQVAADRESLRDVFAALVRLERARPPAAFVSGRDAVDAARAAGLLGTLAPALEERADVALARIDALHAVRDRIDQQRGALASAEADLTRRRADTAALIDARSRELARLQEDSAARSENAAALAARARTLRDLIAEIEARAGDYAPSERTAAAAGPLIPRIKPRPEEIGAVAPAFTPPTGRFADARGTLSPPAAGETVRGFGGALDAPSREGMVIRTRRGALVTSPFDARVEYAGAFGGYGRLLILSVGDDYHIVLAGLSSLYAVAGQTVLAGEPVGEMADASDPAPDLYVEIRKEGQPIDPSPWWRGGG